MFAMVLEVIPLHKIGAAVGTSALVIMFAPAIGPTLAGTLVGAGSWRLVFGAGMASSYGWTSPVVLAALVAGAVRLVLYARRQLSMETPIIDVRIFSHQGFRVGAVCMMVNFGITLSVMYILPQFYQNGMLLAVAVTGVVMLPGGVVNELVSMVAGRIYDRIGARGPAVCGFGGGRLRVRAAHQGEKARERGDGRGCRRKRSRSSRCSRDREGLFCNRRDR